MSSRRSCRRGHTSFDDGETVVEVLPERAARHVLAERTVRGRDDPRIERLVRAAADGAVLARFERAQELRLKIDRQLADLVEKQRTAVRLGEDPSACPRWHR